MVIGAAACVQEERLQFRWNTLNAIVEKNRRINMDVENFRAFEHAGWVNVPRQYHESWGALTSQSIPALLDAAGAGSGVKLLDIATGPGYVAGAAAERGAKVVAVDFSSAMIAQARQIYPDVDFREGDAENLPFAVETFDAAVMNFGILHLARPD